MSAIVLSGGRILSIGGAAFGIGQNTPPPPVPTPSGTLYKTNFGHYMMTGGYEFGTGLTSGANYYYGTELQLWSTLGTNNVAGYAFMIPWWVLEDCTKTVNQNNPATLGQAGTQYAGFQYITQIMNAVQQASPGMSCIMYTKFAVLSSFSQSNITGTNWATSAKVPAYVTTCGGTLTMPTSYGSGTTMTGAVAPIYSGSSYYGFGFAAYSGNTSPASNEYFQVLQPDVHNPVVNQYIIQGLQALLQLPITLSYGPYAGETFTLDQHPQMTLIALNDEYSLNMGSSANFSTGITLNPRLTTGGAPSPTIANFNAGYRGMCAAWSAASQHTYLAPNISFGYTGSNADSPSTVPGYVNHNISTAGISNLPGIVMSSSDGTINQWGLNGWQFPEASWGWQGFIGIGNANGPSIGPLPTPTYPNLTGTMPTLWQVEAGDYNLNSGGSPQPPLGASVAACEQGIIPGAMYVQANWICWALPDGVQFGTNAWTGALNGSNTQFTNYWNGSGVYSVLQSSAGLNSPSQLLATNSMVAPQNLVAIATSTTTATATWTPQTTNTGTGLGYYLYLYSATGTLLNTFTIASNATSSYNITTNLAAGTNYLLAIATQNSNGAGPQSAQYQLIMPMFYFPSFSSGNIGTGAGQIAFINSQSSAPILGSSIALVNSSEGHATGAAWYVSQQNITSFTTDFTFSISNASGNGMTFCVQNSNSSTQDNGYYGIGAAADANAMGYGQETGNPLGTAIYNSIAVSFSPQTQWAASGTWSLTALYVEGGPYAPMAPQQDLLPYGINVGSGHTFAVHIVYDGTILTTVIVDTNTGAQARFQWALNIPVCMSGTGKPPVGSGSSNVAWIGFTGSNPPSGTSNTLISSWDYSVGYATRLATPTFSSASGEYSSGQQVSISAPAGSSVYYTTNGLLPTSASALYTGPITLTANEAIQAVAIQSGYTDSYVASALYQIGTTNVISYPSGFAANDGIVVCGQSALSGSKVQITTASGAQSGAAWFGSPVNISGNWSTTFQMQWGSGAAANGIGFCIQNASNAGESYAANSVISGGPNSVLLFNNTGVGSPSSVLLFFDLYNTPNSVTLYTGIAGIPSGGSPVATGLTFSGGTYNVTVSYNASTTTLSISMQSALGGTTFNHSWTINIPTTVGASTALMGFAGYTGGLSANQYINSWVMNQ